ncbi:MAG: D-(-)-3-hydroxybutyrate oligomer hydrolase [Pseudomonadota bacterium]|nr:D-(-)-3-hydroxybutyrate oligomer hydrolase [Pseudomonadota bacterium]
MRATRRAAAAALLSGLFVSAAAADKPQFIKGDIQVRSYDGSSDDLLTAGLGKTGLQSATAPGFADPLNPTAAELRRRAIYTNYRALVDITTGGGYGVLYGPNVDVNGAPTSSEGKIAGDEYLALIGKGQRNFTVMVQVPASFDPKNPCIVTGPSSGSRGIYGAIATSGEWGLKRGCAVAYTDKGTGTGAHDLDRDIVNRIDGLTASADDAGDECLFTARLSDQERAEFNAAAPNRFAFKHAHSKQNPEKDWDKHVLASIVFAFYALNEKFDGRAIKPDNTIVIASSVSNGGGASLRAAELDKFGLIDGVAVSEPNVNPEPGGKFGIVQGSGAPLFAHSRNLYDYATLVNLYQPCASVAQGTAAPFNLSASPNRCQSLVDKGLLPAGTLTEQANQAQAVINGYGILPEQNFVQPSYTHFFVPQPISVTYANAYGRFGVEDNLCGYSFGATAVDGTPIPLAPTSLAILFAVSNGIPPTGGVNLINNLSVGGPAEDRVSISASTNRQDQNFDGALCLRGLSTGVEGRALKEGDAANRASIERGIKRVLANANLNGIPAIVVNGRNDANLHPNHTSRAYYGLNQLKHNDGKLRYVEITNAHHLDTLNAFAGFDSRLIPLHYYFIQALDILYDHLKNGTPLPPSQVVHTVPRGAPLPPAVAAPQISATNVPPIEQTPAAEDLIRFEDATLTIPE